MAIMGLGSPLTRAISRKSVDSNHSDSLTLTRSRSPPMISTGRGGRGNIGSPKLAPQPNDPPTLPTLKGTYTTGRGGTGNMRAQDPHHPEIAREAQDVKLGPRRLSNSFHSGRGGSGNVTRLSGDVKGGVEQWNKMIEEELRKEEEVMKKEKGMIARGKAVLGGLVGKS